MHVVILSTRENFVWTSMQEILPGIERLWEKAALKAGHKVTVLDVDENTPRHQAKLLLQADLIVVTAFNLSILNYLMFTRKALANRVPWLFYLHGLATIGLWPPLFLGARDLFLTHDIFIGTCPGDRYCLGLIFDHVHYDEIPFYLLSENEVEFDIPQAEFNFHFMGRLSPQKNLLSLIDAFELFHQKNPQSLLQLFGKEDHLGHPNMGIACDDYQDQLLARIKQKGIENFVIFHGFVKREQLQYLLNHLDKQKNMFVTLTGHSDENFGMALYRALQSHWRCIASDWGGHKVHYKTFGQQLDLIPLNISDRGVSPDLDQTLQSMLKIKEDYQSPTFTLLKESELIQKAITVMKGVTIDESTLRLNNTGQSLLDRKQKESYSAQRIFESYQDPYAKMFLNAYKMD